MKTVVSVQDLLERDIKPKALLAEYYRLTAASVAERWADGRGCVSTSCPGCGSAMSQPAFEKIGFLYRVCDACGSLFVSPRPDESALTAYFRDSSAARFWRERILPATCEARREKLAEPRAHWVLDTLAEHAPAASRVIDVSPHGGSLIDVLLHESPGLQVVVAHSGADLDYAPLDARVGVRSGGLAMPAQIGPADAVLACDALDRAVDVPKFVGQVHEVLRPGGLLFLTAPSVSGFDLQVLWERSNAITPPDKLNLLSANGWLARFARPKWDVLEFSTPGMFDVENVRRAVLADPDHHWPRFIRTLIEKDELARIEFQAYLQQFRLASFARLVIQRVP